MTLTTISIIIATVIYVAYNAISLAYFNVPASLSMTYYQWQAKARLGYLFPCMMYMVVACMMPAWISMSEGSSYQFLAFLAPASIAFVATAPAFLSSELENKVHSVSAIVAAICSLAWICLVTPYWWIILIVFGFVALASVVTSTYRTCYVYWLETVAFAATFCSTLIYSM